jgi:hypothetical protein
VGLVLTSGQISNGPGQANDCISDGSHSTIVGGGLSGLDITNLTFLDTKSVFCHEVSILLTRGKARAMDISVAVSKVALNCIVEDSNNSKCLEVI